LIRSLFSGASGMKNHQIRMDVIANNVANVNTTGFKGARVNFQDTLYQNLKAPSAGSDASPYVGGINPSQVGLGVMISSITSDTGQGNAQSTGRMLDVMIQGNGWFILSTDGTNVTGNGSANERYTREGILYIDNAGNLINSNGYNICDAKGEPIRLNMGTYGLDTINIEKNGTITYTRLNDPGPPLTTGPIGLAMFMNQDGLTRDGQNTFKVSPASGNAIQGAGADRFGEPSKGGYGTTEAGFLEMSNVDLTDEFIYMITTQRGYQANARTVTTSDQILDELLNIKR